MDTKHIKRGIFEPLKAHLEEKEISLIVGPRQAGKTTLMEDLRDHLIAGGQKTLFLSMDMEDHRKFFVSQATLLARMKIEFGEERGFVFLDEIQRKTDAGIFLKGLYDMHLPYKMVVSGSGSVELKEKVHESLLGRKRLFELSTVSFLEFSNFKTEYRYEKKLEEYLAIETEEGARLLEEYLSFGGYPRVILSATLEGKRSIINEIYRSYIEKDIAYLLRVERIEAFGSLIKILASQIGQLVNYTELSRTLDISLPTVRNYLWYAEKTFVIEKVTPYFRNARKEITKSPAVYFHDIGLRNYALGVFGATENAYSKDGFLFQNFVYRVLKEAISISESGLVLNFWRTKDRAEVDFIVSSGKRVVPIEVKYHALKQPKVETSLRNFINTYHPAKAFVVNKTFEGSLKVGDTEVIFLPFWKTAGIVSVFE
jgi:predicted AAA+ superfamily ATPase